MKIKILVLIYTLVVVALVLSVKMVTKLAVFSQVSPKVLIADCSDPTPPAPAGE